MRSVVPTVSKSVRCPCAQCVKRSRFALIAAIIAAALICCNALVVVGQTNSADLAGTVKDSGNAVLAGAKATATNNATGLKIERTTNDAGGFLFASLPAGKYSLAVELTGFRTSIRRDIILEIGQVLKLDFVLEVGNVSDQVTIAASEPPLMKTTNAEISDVIENHRIVDLPLNGRQFLQLALLSEGVVKPPGGTRGGAMQQAGDLVNVAGQRSGHNIYLLDGVKITDEYFNNMVISPSVDAIQEFKIQKSMYSAEFGGKASALINVATKSGTSEYHGALFEFLRNDIFDARNFFDDPNRPIPPFRQNQFGGSFGGPVLPGSKGRERQSFFFASYEGQRVRKSVTKTFTVPTAAVRSGDFSGYDPIYDPLSTDGGGARTVFAGNRIPADRLDRVALAFLEKVPLPNRPGRVQNLVSALVESTDMDQFNLRLDHRLSQKDNVFGRLSLYRVNAFQPFGANQLDESLLPGFGRRLDTSTRNLAVSHIHSFNNEVMNELRFGWLDVSGGQTSENKGVDFAGQSGLRGVTTDPRDTGYPLLSFGGQFSAMGDPTTIINRHDRDFELFDNVMLRRGSQTIRFGAYLFHFSFNPSNADTARGSFAFTNRWTSSLAGLADGNAFADFLLGYPTSAQVGIGRGEEDGRTNWLHAYVQDDWEATPNLTINMGLRYELNQEMVDVDNRLSAIDLSVPGGRFVIASDSEGRISSAAAPLLGLLPVPYVTSADAGWSRGLLHPSYRRIAPRIGLAWKIPGKSQTVVRSGFGIYLNQWAYSVQQALARNLPFFLAKNISASADASRPPFRTRDMLTSTVTGTIGGNNMDHDFRVEYNEAWSLSIQRLLTPATLFEVSYFGSRTVGADSSSVRNVPIPGPGPIASRRPFPALSSFTAIRWDGWSTYHAFTAKAERRLSRGVTFVGNYTWSKSIDDASDPGGTSFESNLPQNVRDERSEKALSSFDHRHRFVGSFVYELPFARKFSGRTEKLLAGWQVSSIVTLQSGAPFTVNLGVDRANIGAGPAQRPNLLRDQNLSSGRTPERWLDTSAFSLPNQFTFGNAGRNIVFGPGLNNVDLSLQKETRISERVLVKFRAEAFNALNHPNLDVPNRIAFSPTFGRIFSAEPPRQIQFGLKLEF